MTDPNEKGLPPESLGAAADVVPGPGAEDLWWKPGWKDLVRAGGWRWILMIPAVGVLGLCVLAVLNPRYVGAFWLLGAKWNHLVTCDSGGGAGGYRSKGDLGAERTRSAFTADTR